MSAPSARKFAKASKETNYKDWTSDAKVDDFVGKLKDKAGINEGEANDTVCHVLPDFRNVLAIILLFSAFFAPSLEMKNHAKVSLPTTVMYSLALIYAYIYHCDLTLNPQPSFYALQIDKEPALREFLDWMLTLPVPDYLHQYLIQFALHHVDGLNNVIFAPSAAAFSIQHDYGRFFPLNIFTSMHDILANIASNSNINVAWNRLFNSVMFNASLGAARANVDVLVANFLGFETFTVNADNFYASRFFQIFESVFNPVLLRANQARTSFARINLEQTGQQGSFPNFYDLVFSFSDYNVSELRVVLEAVRDTMKGVIPCSKDLASFFVPSGSGILITGYSEFPVPTWCADTFTVLTRAAVNGSTTDKVPRSPFQYATALAYKVAPTLVMTTRAPSFPSDGTNEATRNLTMVLMVNRAAPNDHLPAATAFTAATSKNILIQHMDVVTAYSSDPELAYLALFLGLYIESNEIDAQIIMHPDQRIPIGHMNSLVFSSAVPIHQVRRATDFRVTTAAANPHHVLTRAMDAAQDQKSAVLLHDASRIIVPNTRTHGHNFQVVGTNAISARRLPGLMTLTSVTWVRPMLRFIGFRMSNSENRDATDANNQNVSHPAHVEPGTLLVWSPYRVIGRTNRTGRSAVLTALPDIYMVTNLRHIVGYRSKAIRINGYEKSLPQ